jgi:hypothetical protein
VDLRPAERIAHIGLECGDDLRCGRADLSDLDQADGFRAHEAR